MSLAEATWNSINVVFAQLDLDVGSENVTHTAPQMGIEAPTGIGSGGGDRRVSALGLRRWKMAMLRDPGQRRHPPTPDAISRVEFPNGKVDEAGTDSGDRPHRRRGL